MKLSCEFGLDLVMTEMSQDVNWNRTILWFCMMKAASVYREFPSYNNYVFAVMVGEGEGGG